MISLHVAAHDEFPGSLMRPNSKYQFLSSHYEKYQQIDKHCQGKCPKLSPWLEHGYMYWYAIFPCVRWPGCFSLATRVTTTVISQQSLSQYVSGRHFIKIGNRISIIMLGKQNRVNEKYFDKMIFEKYKLFTRAELVNCIHQCYSLMIVIIIWNCSLYRLKMGLNSTMELFKLNTAFHISYSVKDF